MIKQTAVEWLYEQMSLEDVCKYSNQLAEAKVMDEQNIKNAYEQGEEDGYWHPENGYDKRFESVEQYYNETFKK